MRYGKKQIPGSIQIDLPRPRGRRASPHLAIRVCLNFELPDLSQKTKEVAVQSRLPSVEMMSVQHFPLCHSAKNKRVKLKNKKWGC